MIKFFRKIRQKLLSENKFSKYLIYAIGEIVLVVIGILIALQINNWNEERKNSDFETQILKEISSSLQNDLIRNKAILNERIIPKKTGIENLIRNLNSKEMEHDSMLRRYYRDARLNVIFTYDNGPYESLKSSGLDKIKNDSLRNQLVNYYDNILPRGKEMINFQKDALINSRKNLEDKLYDYEYNEFETEWRVKKRLNFQSLKSNIDLKKLLDLEEGAFYNYQNRIRYVIESSESLFSTINDNLESKD